MKTIFTKIIEGEIPSIKLHEDALCTVILDINPVNKGHLLVISREPYPTFSECPQTTLDHLMAIAKLADSKLRTALGCEGTNLLINNGEASGQRSLTYISISYPASPMTGKNSLSPKRPMPMARWPPMAKSWGSEHESMSPLPQCNRCPDDGRNLHPLSHLQQAPAQLFQLQVL